MIDDFHIPEDSVLIFGDHRGLYIPRDFAIQCGERWGLDAGDIEILSCGPDHALYWEVWDDTLETCALEYDGKRWRLFQDGDLWAIPEEL
jgi:hypothetical protein